VTVKRQESPIGSISQVIREVPSGAATQLGMLQNDDYAPCANNGQNCANDIYAVSLPAEFPSANITWFQAQEACANAGKRLPTNAEWQIGANGTQDPGPDNGTTDCNTNSDGQSLTGAWQLRLGARSLRHGRQSGRVGGGLGASPDDVHRLGEFQQ